MALKRKQDSKNEEWVLAIANIRSSDAYAVIDDKAEKTIALLRQMLGRYPNAAYGWSGGKDSLVLERLCCAAGIQKSVFVTSRELDYPAFLAWVEEHKPSGGNTIDIPVGFSYLKKNPSMLFPTPSILPKWYAIIQHKGQRRFYAEQKLDVLMLGRRKADGNYIRGNVESLYMHESHKCRICAPIADWTHEDVLAFLCKHNVPMPPIYDFPDGYRQGTHLWPCRLSLGDEQKNWAELFSFAPEIVIKASKYLGGATHFLAMRGQS